MPDKYSRLVLYGLLLFIFGLGLAVRLFDLTDQPVDFHPTRQLRGAIVARGMYYQMAPGADAQQKQLAVSFWDSTGQYEPSILERLVALSYMLIGEERLWISRIYTTIFWTVGGLVIFLLGRRMSRYSLGKSETEGLDTSLQKYIAFLSALGAAGYFFLLPLSVSASRSFQPDPGMVMWIILSAYALYRWSEKQDWIWVIAAGIFGGLAILSKAVAAYFIAGASTAVVLYTIGLKKSLRSIQVWGLALFVITPALLYYGTRTGRAAGFFSSWTISLSHLLLSPSTYIRWFNFLQDLMGMAILLLAVTGVLISKGRNRALLAGLWVGYVVYGLFLPYQMYTHNYYHLALVPIISLSLVPVAEVILPVVFQQNVLGRAAFALAVIFVFLFMAWTSIIPQFSEDHRQEPAYWQGITRQLPDDGKILAMTQDYGYRLMYYGWRKVNMWPNRGEQKLMELRGNEKEFEEFFNKKSEGMSYFLITAFNQFNDQPDLEAYLAANYPVLAEGNGYLIYDLRNPLQ